MPASAHPPPLRLPPYSGTANNASTVCCTTRSRKLRSRRGSTGRLSLAAVATWAQAAPVEIPQADQWGAAELRVERFDQRPLIGVEHGGADDLPAPVERLQTIR